MYRTTTAPEFIRPPYPPSIVYQNPYCSICVEDLTDTGDNWECPSCGYAWPFDATEEQEGLYEHEESRRTRHPVHPTDLFDIPAVRHKDRRKKFLRAHNKP